MSSEYIKITPSEIMYSKKNLLQSQLHILEILKHYHSYQEARKEEFVLKITLKNKIEEAKESLKILDKLLPKTHWRSKEDMPMQHHKAKLDLETEINTIRQKLARLR